MMMERLIPVVVVKDLKETEVILNALQREGIGCAEITFRTACAEEAIRLAVQKFPQMEIGAGTVINGGQCRRALAAGAKFIVSPGLSEEVAELCRERNVPYYPGCVTPTEIMRAIALGITTVKFFPANVVRRIKGDEGACRSLSANQVYSHGRRGREQFKRVFIVG